MQIVQENDQRLAPGEANDQAPYGHKHLLAELLRFQAGQPFSGQAHGLNAQQHLEIRLGGLHVIGPGR